MLTVHLGRCTAYSASTQKIASVDGWPDPAPPDLLPVRDFASLSQACLDGGKTKADGRKPDAFA